jgi:hypothetical protein
LLATRQNSDAQRIVFIRRRGIERRHERFMAADKPRWTEPPLGGGRAAVVMGSVRFSDPLLARMRAPP